jgi:Flp pilus assembly protein TadG
MLSMSALRFVRRPTPRDERGAAALMVAVVTCFVLFFVAALTVDIGNTWARRGSLQGQADRAAKLAAEQLPVDSTTVGTTPTASQLKAAKTAAFYLLCHTVSGQRDLTPTIPTCPSAGTYLTNSAIETFAEAMLSNGTSTSPSRTGSISFPTVNQIKVTAPSAKIEYGFGKLAGADQSIQSKSATAVVLSPGDVLPVGMSATCIANALGGLQALGLGDAISKLLPINYISTGRPYQAGTVPVTPLPATPGDTDWTDVTGLYNNHPATINVNASLSSIAPNGAVTIALDWTSGKTGFSIETIRIYIRKKGYVVGDPTGFYVVDVSIPLLQQGNTSGTQQVSLNLPAGDYEAMVRLSGRNNGNPLSSLQHWINNANQNAEFNVPEAGAIQNVVSCARPAQSPRLGFTSPTGDSDAMAVNFAQGLDHGLAHFPGLGNALDGLNLASTTLPGSVGGLVGTVNSLFQCDTNSRVKKDYSTRRTDGPNCFHVDTAQDWSTAVTQGLLTGGTASTGAYNGRLRCPTTGPCNFKSSRPVLTNPGGITGNYNNDAFADFIKSPGVLNDPFFMALDSFLSPSLPLVTPPNNVVDEALYDSPRFFWAPVSLSAFTTIAPGAAGHHPILAFRPVFLTSDSSTSTAASSIDTLLLDLVTAAASRGYSLQSVLQNFTDSLLNLNPCDGVVSLLSILTGLLTGPQANTCALTLLKTPMFSSTSGTTTVGAFIEKYLGSNIVTKDSSNTGSFGGLVIDKAAAKVRAARIMTIAPGALPAVPRNYSGPTTDYLGVGPKIIRLVK